MGIVIKNPTDEKDATLENVVFEPHGVRNVEFIHKDFRRRVLDQYGRCTTEGIAAKAIEMTCKAVANRTGDSNDMIATVYGISVLNFAKLNDLTINAMNNCYADAAVDATKRLSTCVDIYYKNRHASRQHDPMVGDGEEPGIVDGRVAVQYTGIEELQLGHYQPIDAISVVGNVSGEVNLTITPRNALVKGMARDPEQVIEADMVYELPAHTLSDINAELKRLQVFPTNVGFAYIEVRESGDLIKTLTFKTIDMTALEVIMEPCNVYASTTTAINPIVFTGKIEVISNFTVEPINCAVTGFKSSPDMVVAMGGSYTFRSDNIAVINEELAHLKVTANATGSCSLKVTYPNGEKVFNIVVRDATYADAEIYFNITSKDVTLMMGERTPIPAIVAEGVINSTTKITVTPKNCVVSGFASDPGNTYCANSAYTFSVADINTINTELAALAVLPSQEGVASITISYGSYSKSFDFVVKAGEDGPVNIIVPTVQTMTTLEEGEFKNVGPILFNGKIGKPTAVVTMIPLDCEVTNVTSTPDTVFDSQNVHVFAANNLKAFNNEFANMQIKPKEDATSATIELLIEEGIVFTFSFHVGGTGQTVTECNCNPVLVSSDHLGDTLIVDQLTDAMALNFSGCIRNATITITPENCVLTGVRSDTRILYSVTNPCTYVAASAEEANAEFANISLIPMATSNVKLNIKVNDLVMALRFSNVIEQ